MPDSVISGRYLVKVSGPEPTEMGASGAIFLQLPEGVTPEQAYEDTQAAGDSPPPGSLMLTLAEVFHLTKVPRAGR
ncbi:MAG: hypothetical protein M9934_00970 [Thermomicrobiales bacterium]|nr:hypothetical protein [Thermomicrobiales bacterium]